MKAKIMKKQGGILTGLVIGFLSCLMLWKWHRRQNCACDDSQNRLDEYYRLLLRWLELKQKGISVYSFFESAGYYKIAIYGLGELGKKLYEELKGTDVEVLYAIDQNPGNQYVELDIREIQDTLPEVDAVIVTPVFAYEQIEKKLLNRKMKNIISLDELIYSL